MAEQILPDDIRYIYSSEELEAITSLEDTTIIEVKTPSVAIPLKTTVAELKAFILSGAGSGDMLAATYDPTNVAGDAFDMDNMNDGTTNKLVSATEKSNWDAKLDYLPVIFSYSGETLTSTKTVAEIIAAITANKQIIAYYIGIVGIITENITVGADLVIFTFQSHSSVLTVTGDGSGETDSWTLVEENIEKTSNKVSTWSVTPNDTNYPTEKLVYDSLTNKADLVDGLVPSSQLPSFVDDVIELRTYSDTAPTTDLADNDKYYAPTAKLIYTYDLDTTSWDAGVTPERGKIYVVLDDSVLNKQYRWGGSDMAAIVNSDIAGLIHASETKDIIVNADEFGFVDSENGNVLKKTTWSNIKAKLITLFDSIYIKLSNLVTTISSSSTNAQIPSAKLLYDQLQMKANLLNNTFIAATLPSSADWYNVCYGNGKYVAVANNSDKAAYSTDGINWVAATLPSSAEWSCVCYGNGKYVAVAYNSDSAAYSTDGINWVAATLPSSAYWYSVCYGNGKYVAVAYNSAKAAYSTDGINWVAATLPSSGRWYNVCYGNGKYVAVAYLNSDKAAYSTDGINWVAATLPSVQSWGNVCYGNGKFVVVATNSDKAAYSTDGINWVAATLPSSADWYNVCYGNGKYVAVAYNSDSAAYSTDGINWVAATLPSVQSWGNVCYGNGKFVTVAANSDKAAYLEIKKVADLDNQRINYDAKDIYFDNTISNLEADNAQDAIDELAAKKGSDTGTDEKVKYDADDPTAGYIADKFVAGTGISLAEGTGANENKLVITSTSGDMLASTYDPTSVEGDAFDMDNMAEGDTNLILTSSERTKISNSLTYFTLTYYQAKPATCTTGETCFDTSDGKIYTATGTDTWGSGVAASTNVIYKWKGKSYQYVSGTKLVRLDNLSPNVVVLSDTSGTAISTVSSYSVNTKLFCQLNNTATTRAITISAPTNDACCELTFENNTESAITITFPNASGIVNYPYSTSGIIISAGLRRTISWEMTGEASSTDMNIFWGDEQTAVS